MGMAFKAPKNYRRTYYVSNHAIEQYRARSTRSTVLSETEKSIGDLLDWEAKKGASEVVLDDDQTEASLVSIPDDLVLLIKPNTHTAQEPLAIVTVLTAEMVKGAKGFGRWTKPTGQKFQGPGGATLGDKLGKLTLPAPAPPRPAQAKPEASPVKLVARFPPARLEPPLDYMNALVPPDDPDPLEAAAAAHTAATIAAARAKKKLAAALAAVELQKAALGTAEKALAQALLDLTAAAGDE